jgi:hypothetical protein
MVNLHQESGTREGLGRGIPYPHMLFLFAMEPLHLLFCKAQDSDFLAHLHHRCSTFKMSLYADGTTVFINPTSQDLQATWSIPQLFIDASGLNTNMDKTKFYTIQCQDIRIRELLGPDQNISSFPCSYLGLPLHYKKLPKTVVFP